MTRLGSKLIALLAVGLGWTACSSDLAPEQQPQGGAVLVVDATKDCKPQTRGLTNSLQAIWNEGDAVTVLAADGSQIGTMTPLTTGAAKTRLTANLTSAVALNDALTLAFPRTGQDYTGQVGTLADIAARYDYATAAVRIRYMEDGIVSATDAVFDNQQAIVKFSLTDGSAPLQVSSLTVAADGLKQNATTTGEVTITPASATDQIYAALSGVSGKVTLTATAGDETYHYTTANSQTFENGAYYPITVAMKSDRDPMLGNPLTIEAIENDTQITFINNATGKVQYSSNQTDWTDISSGGSRNISVDAGGKIYFRGSNASYYPGNDRSSITCSDPCYVYGNIMSLVDATAFAKLTSLPEGSDTFRSLFEGNENLRNHPDKELLLPATTLRESCYKCMFQGCTGLTRAPVLPAPALLAHSYELMFSGCLSLAYIKCLATNIEATGCTSNWVDGVKDTGSFVKAGSMSGWETGSSGIPAGWTVTSE